MPEPLEIRPHHLAGLCLVTESNLPHEWPAILQVILYRVASPRYPDTVEGVILQRKQFSRLNELTGVTARPTLIYSIVAKADIGSGKISPLLLAHAQDFCAWLYTAPSGGPWEVTVTGLVCPDISPETLHYYSPVSMVPKGSAPAWAKTAKRLYTPPGIDPERFVFCEGVR